MSTTVDVRPAGPVAAFLGPVGVRPDWQRDALCREYADVDWFSSYQAPAKAICARGLVRAECLAAGEHKAGTWGGTSPKERTAMRRARS